MEDTRVLRIISTTQAHDDFAKKLREDERISLSTFDTDEGKFPIPAELAAKADVLFCGALPANFKEMVSLRWLQLNSAGYAQVYPFHLATRGVQVTNARGVNDVPIAEWNMAMMVNLARNLRGMIRNQENGIWDRSARFQREIRGLTVGLWGYGGIGRATARLAKCFGMRVHAHCRSNRSPRANCYYVPDSGDPEGIMPDRYFHDDERKEFLESVDFLIIAMPQTPQTEGIVGEKEIGMLRPTAFILNPARGPIIQEAALVSALRENRIAGAALDTHYHYPMPPDHPLWHLPNVIMTPHISGSSASPFFLERVWDLFLQNVEHYRAGTPMLNVIPSRDLG